MTGSGKIFSLATSIILFRGHFDSSLFLNGASFAFWQLDRVACLDAHSTAALTGNVLALHTHRKLRGARSQLRSIACMPNSSYICLSNPLLLAEAEKLIAIFDGLLYQVERGRDPLIATRSRSRQDLPDTLKADSIVVTREVR